MKAFIVSCPVDIRYPWKERTIAHIRAVMDTLENADDEAFKLVDFPDDWTEYYLKMVRIDKEANGS